MTELIKVTQLPVIEEQLRLAKERVDAAVGMAMALVCNEDTLQCVKATRADLNKQFAELEAQRKAVKAAVLDPYNMFEAVYRECVSDAYKRADADLKQKISDVEGEMKRRCEDALRAYYSELCEAHHIDFAPFERAGVVISMTDAKAKTQPPKRLQEQLSQFVSGLAQGRDMIATMENADEIMADFMVTLNAMEAVGIVQERHRRIEAEKAAREARAAVQKREEEAVQKVEAFAPPVEKAPEPEQEKVYRCTFSVTATKAQLKKLKEFMNMEGIKYE